MGNDQNLPWTSIYLLYSRSVSLAILGLEATLGSDLPARLMAMILNWYSCPFTSFCSVTVVAAVSRHSQICQSPPCSHKIVHNNTTIQCTAPGSWPRCCMLWSSCHHRLWAASTWESCSARCSRSRQVGSAAATRLGGIQLFMQIFVNNYAIMKPNRN